jgi:hypothetical protein
MACQTRRRCQHPPFAQISKRSDMRSRAQNLVDHGGNNSLKFIIKSFTSFGKYKRAPENEEDIR